MSKRTLLGLCLVCSLVIACGKSETINTSTNSSKATPAADRPAAPPTNDAVVEKIGVAECDKFIADYEACVTDKVPAANRDQFRSSIVEWRNAWKRLAANPQGKPMLEAACKSAVEQARTSMKAYNCTF